MTQALHLAKKDLRRLRWDLSAWCLCIGARGVVATAGADLAFMGFGPQLAIDQLGSILALIEMLLLALIVSRLVHDEPLVGQDAFWLTRPIAGGALMAEKLALTTFFLLLVPVAGDIVVAATFGTPATDVIRTIPVFVIGRALWISLLMAIAVLTPSLLRYVLTIVGIIAGLASLIAVMVFVSMLFASFEDSGSDTIPDPTQGVVAQVLLIAAALAVVVYQYRSRRLKRAIALAIVGPLSVPFLAGIWPWSFAPPVEPVSGLPADQASAVTVVHDAGEPPRVIDGFWFGTRTPPKKAIALHVTVGGLPPDVAADTIVARARLELPGKTLDTNRRGGASLSGMISGSPRGGAQAALGVARLIAREDFRENLWPVVLRVSEEEFARYSQETGRLTAALDVVLARSVVAGTMPLADGATLELGSRPFDRAQGRRIKIVRVIRRATGCTVLLRHSRVEPLFSRPHYRMFSYALRNTAQSEAAAGDLRELSRHGFNAGPLREITVSRGPGGFILEQYELQFPVRGRGDSSSVTLDESWISGAEFAIVESVQAGVVTRQMEIAAFKMRP